LESAYESCLCYELCKAGLFVEKQKTAPVVYKDLTLPSAYRMDLVVENKIVIEVKAVEEINDIHVAQILTYLKFSGNRVGLLLNFNVSKLKNGITRVIK
jgi:GxxExxY protein